MSMGHHSIPVAHRPSTNGHSLPMEPPAAPTPEESVVPPGLAAAPQQRVLHTPLIDIHESPAGLILEADLPGVSENGLTIQLEDNVLSLHARVEPPAADGVRLVHEEYRVGDFARSFILSDEVDRAAITAEFKNGVLRLVLPKGERVKTRRIEIKS